MSQPFDFNKALKALQSGQALTGKDGILMPLIKQLTEAALALNVDGGWRFEPPELVDGTYNYSIIIEIFNLTQNSERSPIYCIINSMFFSNFAVVSQKNQSLIY